MKIHELFQLNENDKDSINQLIEAVEKWTQNTPLATPQHYKIINQSIKMFPYQGPMYRYMEIWDSRWLSPSGIKQKIKTEARSLASWSRTKEGLEEFVSYVREEDVEWDLETPIMYCVTCEQNTTGFSVEKLFEYLKSNNLDNPMIERAASVHEVIAPYDWNTFKFTITDIQDWRSNSGEE